MIKKLNSIKTDFPLLSPVTDGKASNVYDLKMVRKIALPTLSGISFKKLEQIISLQANSNYTNVRFTNGDQLIVCKTLKEFEIRLLDYPFFRVHRSTIVNMTMIENYVRGQGGYVVMEDGSNVQVSKHRRNVFLKAIERYWV